MARLVQTVGNLRLVYVDDAKAEWATIAEEFGMVRNGVPLSSTVIDRNASYANQHGVTMRGVRLTGRTVALFITNSAMVGPVSSTADMVPMLNNFPSGVLSLGGMKFYGKFLVSNHAYRRTVTDARGNKFYLGTDNYPDVEGIIGLASRMSEDNGDIFRPVIARFVYASREMPRTMRAVGYFDLLTYMKLIRSDARSLFYTGTLSTAPIAVDYPTGGRLGVRVVSVTGNVPNLELFGHKGVVDVKSLTEFRPLVVLSLTPLVIRDMRFPIQKVTFDRTTVFMTPIVSKIDAWKTLQGGVDLLEPPKK